MINMKDLIPSNISVANPLQATVEENYVLSTLNYMKQVNLEYIEAKKKLNVCIIEATSYDVLHEGFSDFKETIKNIISKFIKFIKGMFERFITSFNKMIKSEKFLRGKESLLAEFSSEDEFEYKGFEFTISPDVPVINIVKEFTADFVGLDPDQMTGAGASNYLDDQLSKLNTEVDDDSYYDSIRGEVLGKSDTPIYKEDYNDELFKVFRNGEDSKITYTITSSVVIANMNLLKGHEKTKTQITKDKNKIEKEYKQLEKKLKNISSDSSIDATGVVNLVLGYDKDPGSFNINSKTMATVDAFIAAKCNQVKEISNIHALAFAAKLEAEKECYKQSKDILYNSLQRIQKRKRKEP